jgi:hypothetical protein
MQEDIKERLLWTGAFILVLALGFFAGRISVKIDQVSTVDPIKEVGEIATFVPTINFTSFDKGILYGKTNGKDLRVFVADRMVENKNGSFFIDTNSLPSNTSDTGTEKFLYVASKNSTKYHPIGSKAANSIKPENRIYFVSKEEAESKGFTPASDVK